MGPAPDAAQRIQLPAIFLMVVAGVGALLQLFSLVANVAGMGMSGMSNSPVASMMSGGVGIVFSIIGLLVAGFLVYGGLKMKSLENWTLALAASIVAMVPFVSPCCCLGLPIGIWAIVILVKPEIKAAFRG